MKQNSLVKPFLSFYFFMAMALPALGESKDCKHRIVFIPSFHRNNLAAGEAIPAHQLDELAQAQFRIAKYIEKNPNVPVFSEQAAETISFAGKDPAKVEMATKPYRELFPNGFPDQFQQLTPEQKGKVANLGGEYIMLMLRKTGALHKTIESPALQKKLKEEAASLARQGKMASEKAQAAIDPAMKAAEVAKFNQLLSEYKKITYDQRENLTLDELNQFFAAHPQQKDAILVYGSNHDFSRHPGQFPS